MTWRVYRWDDSGAPPLSANGNALIWLLDAVLINGYGSKPAAGWTGLHISGDTTVAYTNAGSGKTLKVTHSAATAYANVVGCESTDGTTGPFFPTAAQQASGLFWTLSNTSDGTERPWIIIADNKRFYLWVGYNLTTGGLLSASTTLQQLHFAGDILSYKGSDANHFAVIGGISNTAPAATLGNIQTGMGTTMAAGHYLARSYTQSGGSAAFGKFSDYSMAGHNVSGQVAWTYPDPVSGGLILSPIRLYESGIMGPRGIMPGLWFVNHTMPGSNGDTFGGSAGGPLAGKSFILLDACASGTRSRFALETSDTLGL